MKQIRRTAFRDGKEYQAVVDSVEIQGDIEETDRGIAFDVVLAKEIVQKYRDHGRVYKPADELKKAAEVSGSVYITDGHPPQGVVQKQEQVYGEIDSETLKFDDSENRVVGRAEVFEDQAPDGFVQEIQDEDRDSVSIGFYTQVDRSSGSWNDEEYDAVQRDILLDHLAVLKPENEGRCSVENGCGITQNMDQVPVPVADREFSDADPEDLSEGDRVTWGDDEARRYGMVDQKETDGTVEADPFDQSMEGSEDNPAFRVEMMEWDSDEEEWISQEEFTVHRADPLTVIDEFPEMDEGLKDYDLAVNEPEDPRDIADEISGLGYEVEVRECNCGDHEGHLTVFDPETDGRETTYLSEDDKSSNKDSGANFMEDIDTIGDLDMDQLKEHPEVQDLLDEKASLEDEKESLEEDNEELEQRVEDLEDQLSDIREEEADEIREELQDEYGLDEEKLEDEDLESLKTRKETLSEADMVQKDSTSTSPGQSTDSKSNDETVGSGGSGPYSDQYGSEEE